jgi:hypothetical protein
MSAPSLEDQKTTKVPELFGSLVRGPCGDDFRDFFVALSFGQVPGV